MSRSNVTLYLGLAAAGAGGYYLYRAGGDPKAAKEEMKHDASKARSHMPTAGDAEKTGERVGAEAGASIEEAVNNARAQAEKFNDKIPQIAHDGINKVDEIRHDAAKKLNTTVDKLDKTIEDKASEAKGTLSGWFGSKK